MTTPDRCASCGAGVAPSTRFCRNCGAAVEATESAAAVRRPADDASQLCPSCAVPVVQGAAFCGSCGARLPAPGRPPQGRASPSPGHSASPLQRPAPPPRRRGRGPLLAVGAFAACLGLGGLVAGGVYLLTREDRSADVPAHLSTLPADITQGRVTGAGQEAGGLSGIPPAARSADSGSGELSPPAEAQKSAALSALAPGRYVQSGSFRSAEGAEREVNRLQGDGIDVFSMPAALANELLPGFHVLLVGPLSGRGEERRVIRQLGRASVSGLVRDLTPSAALPGPAASAGSWSGAVEQSFLRGPRRRTTYRIEIAIDADGERGAIEYPERGCRGSLSLIEDARYSLAYLESILSGPCPAGGVWHLRRTDAGLTAVRLHDDREVMVEGTLSAN